MKKLATLFVLICLFAFVAPAQTVLLDVDKVDTTYSKFGPNRKHFVHLYFSYGLIFGKNNEGAKTRVPGSNDFKIGLRYKYKISELLSLGVEANYGNHTFDFRQEEGKVIVDTTLHDEEEIIMHYLEPTLFLRFNIGERGNSIGRFIDFGAGLPIRLVASHFTQNELSTGEVQTVTTSRLSYVQSYYAHAFARIGFNNLAFFYQYRFTDFFTNAVDYPALPAMTMGIQLGIH